MRTIRQVLWLDCSAAALAGVIVLSFSSQLGNWYALPETLLRFIGAVNIAYACYSCSLAIRAQRSETSIMLLAWANGFWALACLGIAAVFAQSLSPPGLVHLLGEAAFVGGLASVEWTWRKNLLNRYENHASTPCRASE